MTISAKKYWDVICGVQSEVNFEYSYKRDIDQYNKSDFWAVMGDKRLGDCEDFALTKRKLLIDRGVPIEALRLTLCYIEDGRYHAVLIVVTDQGDYVLDNRHQDVHAIDDLPYKWDKMQDSNGDWREII